MDADNENQRDVQGDHFRRSPVPWYPHVDSCWNIRDTCHQLSADWLHWLQKHDIVGWTQKVAILILGQYSHYTIIHNSCANWLFVHNSCHTFVDLFLGQDTQITITSYPHPFSFSSNRLMPHKPEGFPHFQDNIILPFGCWSCHNYFPHFPETII